MNFKKENMILIKEIKKIMETNMFVLKAMTLKQDKILKKNNKGRLNKKKYL